MKFEGKVQHLARFANKSFVIRNIFKM